VSDIFREIDEELRRDNLLKLWQRYGHVLVGLAVLIVVGSALWVGWQDYQLRQRQSASQQFNAALELARGGKAAAAADGFGAIARTAPAGNALLARLAEAAERARAGDTAAAIAAYDGIANDAAVDPAYRDLARVLSGLRGLDTVDPKTIIERMAPLTAADNPWHASALEVTALAQLKSGDRAAARTTYQRVADDLQAPAGLRARAAEMVAALAS
jgi:hypothetical protein